MKKNILLIITLFVTATALNAQWQQGNGLNGGTVNCLAVKDTIILAGTDTGGVFVSTDNGLNWTPSNNGLPEKNVVGLLVKGNTIVAAIGSGFGSGCFFLSTDNGATWVPPNNQYYGFVYTLVLNGSDILAGTWFGVARSTNDGSNWTSLPPTGLPSNASVSAIAVHNTNIYAGVSSSSAGGTGVFMSANNGTDWDAKNTGLSNTVISSMAEFGGTVFAGTNGGGLFATTDSGETWDTSGTGITNSSINSLYKGGAHLFAGTNNGIFISSDGANWKSIMANLPANTAVSSVITKDNFVYIGTGETVWRRLVSEINTGVNPLPIPAQAEIYPNPTDGKFTVSLNEPAVNVSVVNTLGEVIYSTTAAEINRTVIDLSSTDIVPGIYFIRTETGNGAIATHKIYIQ